LFPIQSTDIKEANWSLVYLLALRPFYWHLFPASSSHKIKPLASGKGARTLPTLMALAKIHFFWARVGGISEEAMVKNILKLMKSI
jgi:hypothetical protein